MDQFAFHDIPDSINYVLSTTGQPSLSFIGFSQGTAQAFAALAIHPSLNEKIDVFIALAPAMSPAGLRNGIVDALVKASPEVIFLAFGRRMILSSTTTWQALLYPPIFVRIIDTCLEFLFGWTGRNIPAHQKLAAYAHLYSYTSTKSIVHWFQIIRTKSFQMYDDDVQAPLSLSSSSGRYYKVAKFPTRNIKTPIVLVYGGSDSLVDINVMLKELPKHTVATEIPHFEHLDFLWAAEVDTLVFPHVFNALDSYAARDHSKALPSSTFNGRYITAGPIDSEDDRFGGTTIGASSGDAGVDADVDQDSDLGRDTRRALDTSTLRSSALPSSSARRRMRLQDPMLSSTESTPDSKHADTPSPSRWTLSTPPQTSKSPDTKTDSPSSTDGPADSQSGSKHSRKARRSSQSSSKSSESLQKAGASLFGESGITLGTARAVGGGIDRKGAKGLVGQEREPIFASHKRQHM
jgi:lysosomal acid lipase/cholesteryl ester hydrolase